MQYLAMLYAEEDERFDPTSEAFAAELRRYDRFGELADRAIVGGEALAPSSEAVTIRHRRGEAPIVTDGPYTEAAEVIGGFYVLEVEDLDAAVELARHIPAAEDGAVEVRPLVEWSHVQRAASESSQRYLALLAGEETTADRPGTAEWDAAVAEHGRFAAEAGDAVVGGGALHPTETATTVRVRNGEVILTDGAFPESGEVVGGLYLLRADSRREVVALASRIPMGDSGMVEVRPLMELGQ